ncbi:hypothetical protein DAEQUDRAFT_3213 [Daedalea quercina L-15889]|uniref:Uncharacterized protein n=1 Tax=Daedalea quercina L-15889 TaxID=1314783 RepID=A0A165UCA3_9APHY|nr:hypothetical protein DAEQUDRAFT_3213 [Daedalea quercina L-15889]
MKTVLKFELRRGRVWPSVNTPLRRVSGWFSLVDGYLRARLPRTQCLLARLWFSLVPLNTLSACRHCRADCQCHFGDLAPSNASAAEPRRRERAALRSLEALPSTEKSIIVCSPSRQLSHQEHLSAGAGRSSCVHRQCTHTPVSARVANVRDGITLPRSALMCADAIEARPTFTSECPSSEALPSFTLICLHRDARSHLTEETSATRRAA